MALNSPSSKSRHLSVVLAPEHVEKHSTLHSFSDDSSTPDASVRELDASNLRKTNQSPLVDPRDQGHLVGDSQLHKSHPPSGDVQPFSSIPVHALYPWDSNNWGWGAGSDYSGYLDPHTHSFNPPEYYQVNYGGGKYVTPFGEGEETS